MDCPRFSYYGGPRCEHCNYLHHKNQCPIYVRDPRTYLGVKDNSNSYRNAQSVEIDKRQLQDYIPAVAQPGTKQTIPANVNYLQDANIFQKKYYLTRAIP